MGNKNPIYVCTYMNIKTLINTEKDFSNENIKADDSLLTLPHLKAK